MLQKIKELSQILHNSTKFHRISSKYIELRRALPFSKELRLKSYVAHLNSATIFIYSFPQLLWCQWSLRGKASPSFSSSVGFCTKIYWVLLGTTSFHLDLVTSISSARLLRSILSCAEHFPSQKSNVKLIWTLSSSAMIYLSSFPELRW